jgi:hypothetical protein
VWSIGVRRSAKSAFDIVDLLEGNDSGRNNKQAEHEWKIGLSSTRLRLLVKAYLFRGLKSHN